MANDPTPALQVIAMHGWASDGRCWKPWIEATQKFGWRWECGERGYGTLEPHVPAWSDAAVKNGKRLIIAHSLGLHLLPPGILSHADAVVLLTSFGTFVPPNRAGRRLRAALASMTAKLEDEGEARKMLRQFLENAAAPEPAALMPQGPNNDESLNLERLLQDLDLLANCGGLPAEFPSEARVLAIEAGRDQIVAPEARALLRNSLPGADWVRLENAGHALLGTDIAGTVSQWIESRR